MVLFLCCSYIKIGRNLKGLGHEMNIFLMSLKLNQYLSLHAQLVYTFLGCLFQEKYKRKVSACFFETLTNSKYCSGSRIRISVHLSSLSLADFFFASLLLVDFLQCTRTQAAFSKHSQDQIAVVG
jgi:hypothetical protein